MIERKKTIKTSFNKFLEDVVKLPYKPNQQNNPQHENQIEELLKKYEIKYEPQPNGSQAFPDFYLPDQDLNLECKSTANYAPMWNCSLPRPDGLYILCSKKLNKTNMFFGKYVLSEENYNKLIEQSKMLKQYIKDNQGNSKDYGIYDRLAFQDKGGNYEEKYFDYSYSEKVLEHYDY